MTVSQTAGSKKPSKTTKKKTTKPKTTKKKTTKLKTTKKKTAKPKTIKLKTTKCKTSTHKKAIVRPAYKYMHGSGRNRHGHKTKKTLYACAKKL
jgi:hypothetical protein